MTVFGVEPQLDVKATLVVDDQTTYEATRDTAFPDIHRLRFMVTSPPTHAEWGGWVTLDAVGYVKQEVRVQIGGGDHELTGATMEPVVAPVPKRTGVVRAEGKATADDGGLWHPFGTTFFWAMQGWKNERDRFKENATWLRAHGVDYFRILNEVAWENREIDPSLPQWADYDTVLAELLDWLYNTLGVRVENTLLGKGTSNPPTEIARRVADVVAAGRQHMVINFEMANEYDVGRGPDIATMVEMSKVVRARVPNLLALSSPGSWEDLRIAVDASPADAFTVHPDRGPGDAKWRQVRQGYDFKDVRFWVSNNEPAGPASSVATNDNPLQLAMMRAVGVMCGGSAYVLHTGTGVFGDGKPHPSAGPRPANFWEIDNIEAIIKAVRGVDAVLPPDVENWQVANTQWRPPLPVAPFQPHAHWEGLQGSGVNKAYSALAGDGRVIQMPCGVLHHALMTASYAMVNVTVYDPLTLKPLDGFEGRSFAPGDTMDLPGTADSMTAYIIHGQRI